MYRLQHTIGITIVSRVRSPSTTRVKVHSGLRRCSGVRAVYRRSPRVHAKPTPPTVLYVNTRLSVVFAECCA